MTRRAPIPSSFEVRTDAQVMTLRNELAFAQRTIGELEREIAALRRLQLRDGIDPAARVWLTIDEAADICCVTPATMRTWVRNKGVGIPSDRGHRVIKANLIEYLQERGRRVPSALRD